MCYLCAEQYIVITMKIIVRTILAAIIFCLPVGMEAQGVITGPRKMKKQTTAPAKTTPKKRQVQLTPKQMYEKGMGAYERDNFSEAVKWFMKSADQCSAEAQNMLGWMSEMGGRGVPKDYSEAVRWYRMAADRGFALAQRNLGSMYENGKGVSQDYAEAMRWFRKAADQGDEWAQYYMGVYFEHGYGVAQDIGEAKRWYQKAAAQGHSPSKNKLAGLK